MEESATRTSTKQRIIILIIAILMLGSFVAVYVAIILGKNSNNNNTANQEEVNQLQQDYTAKKKEVDAEAVKWSEKYFQDFLSFKSNVKGFNATTANSDGLKTNDLRVGTGRELSEGNNSYFAYYIGYCADEKIFDSSFDSTEKPAALKAPIDASAGLIEGWNRGVVGMKIGGVRELSIPGELAYGNSREICGGKNSPLHFIVMALEKTDPLAKLSSELEDITAKMMDAYYGKSK